MRLSIFNFVGDNIGALDEVVSDFFPHAVVRSHFCDLVKNVHAVSAGLNLIERLLSKDDIRNKLIAVAVGHKLFLAGLHERDASDILVPFEMTDCSVDVHVVTSIKNKKIITIIGAPKIGKTIFSIIFCLINKNKKVIDITSKMAESYEETKEDVYDCEDSFVQLLEQIKPELRLTATLYYYDDLSIREIAQTLDIPEGTVKSRLAVAREKLYEMLVRERREVNG